MLRDSTDVHPTGQHADEVTVLVVDDQKVFRDVMVAVIQATPGMKLVGEADCGDDALLAVDALSPEFVILDVRMPGIDGLEVARMLLQRTPPPVIMLVSAQPAPAHLPTTSDGRKVAFVEKRHLRPAVLLHVWTGRSQPDGFGSAPTTAGSEPDSYS